MFNFNYFKNRDFKKTEIQQHDLTDCGATCLAAVAAYYNLEVPISRIRQIAYTDQKGTNLLGMIEAAKQLGFDAKGVKVNNNQISELPGPCIAHVIVRGRLHHYVVVLKSSDLEVTMMDPAFGKVQTIPTEEFFTIWTNVILLLEPNDAFEAKNEKYSVGKRFWFLLKPYTFIFTQILIGSVFAVILGLATSLYIQKIIDNVLPNNNGNLLNLMGVLMIAIILFSVILGHFKSILTLQTGQKIDAKLILGYYKHLLKLPQQFFDTMRTGEIISRINDAVKIRAFINDVIVGFIVNIFVLIFSFTLMFVFYWKLALLMLVVIPLYVIIYYFSNKVNKKTQRELMENSADLEAQLVESLNAVSTIKRFGIEDFTNLKTEGRFINLLKSIYESGTNGIWIGNLSGLVTSVFTVVLLWVGTSFVLQNELTAGELLSFYAIMGYFTGPVASFISMNKTIQDSLIAADRLFEIMDIETESDEGKVRISEEQIGDIQFKDVEFSYGSRNQVFTGLDLEIEAGKITAIVGQSGSGKSTLTSIIQKVYPISSGRVYIGKQNLEYIHEASLKKLIGVVPQNIHLFAGNILDNIAVGDFNPDLDKVLTICQDLGILEFIEELPQGFKTYIGENGVSLSGGQRQRLAIARALYKDPSILIFDEATSALDSESEAFTLKTLYNLKDKGKTVILIAHRLSSVISADKILVMDKGSLIESGGHTELLETKGTYHRMWQKQMPDFQIDTKG
ncbi:peptidase domain-containing ABC transporter [Belliella sp. DSM 107340]|uniref:Peptidase domain-containing ABC transporter n=1 Tax=Belliella calami TaxID=2923436 RepID=A0ABS9UIN9_9BACT|nr:peptidase domain-containing ABC transporter [Belliella calami]MCH7396481.1 peptidase domain-containing ABC transporter [Belliella calami]